MLLREICTPDVVYCGPNTGVLAAARLMREKHVGDLIVVDDPHGDQTPLGMVTDRDIVIEVLGKELDPRTTTVAEIMHKPAVIASDDEDVSQAIDRMKAHGVRRVPVTGERGRLVGIVALDDLLRKLAADASALADCFSDTDIGAVRHEPVEGIRREARSCEQATHVGGDGLDGPSEYFASVLPDEPRGLSSGCRPCDTTG